MARKRSARTATAGREAAAARRRAVRARDDSLRVEGRIRVDFRNDQGDVGLHPEVTGLVDNLCTGLDRGRQELGSRVVGSARDDQIQAREAVFGQLFDRVVLTLEFERRSGRTRRGEKRKLFRLEVPLFEQLQNDGSHGTGGTDDGH